MNRFFLLSFATSIVLSCKAKTEPSVAQPPQVEQAQGPTLSVEFLRKHLQRLSADAMQGRLPGTDGAKQAVQHIIKTMQTIGLEPAGENGTWTQTVPMRSVRTDVENSKLALKNLKCIKANIQGCQTPWEFGTDWVGTTFAEGTTHALKAPFVFLGYGVTAPEYGWDDYGDYDMKGKIAVVFVGDPPTNDERFGGKAMTYYGRWSYKFERAQAAGAIGCLVIHEKEPASYDWNVPKTSYSGENFHVVQKDDRLPPALQLEGWISEQTADALAREMGASGGLRQWHEQAMKEDFKPVEKANLRLAGTIVTSESFVSDVNVVGKLPGSSKSEEYVLLSAHWDHLGVEANAEPNADAIYNGAVDNASGVAVLLGVAAGLAERKQNGNPLARSVVFLATTAEEQGLLGARYYASNPLVPLAKVSGLINMDSMNVHGPTQAVEVVGGGQSSLEDDLAMVVKAQGRQLLPDARPESGGYYRSDHLPFAQQGVPAIYFHSSLNHLKQGDSSSIQQSLRTNYHTVRDEFDASWPLTGLLQDAQTILELLVRVGNAETMATWKPNSEFAKVQR